ncbi:carbonic anhydrase 6 [Pteropus vampyrus]|uniref:Carbonic anhydrase n=1 Tax=Pteropus vampyrus TaxID=132908 RepID=A0A6P6BZ50_PTEVA|nr:carbonic anhydrase 6 [Pteropus vampyrus]
MTPLVTLLPLLLLGAVAQQESKWTYSDEAHWSEKYPACGGKRQSPINLQARKVRYNPSVKALHLTGYEAQDGEFLMTNDGHTVMISLPSSMRMVAPDGTEYKALQMHFHWGGASSKISGSEHTIEGIRYATEIHIMHYNSKYSSSDVARNAPDGLAVLAVLIEVNDYAENTYFSNFISHLENVKYPGQSTVLNSLDLQDMLPKNLHDHYSYQGSTSTPPCTENVHWFVLADPIKLSKAQRCREGVWDRMSDGANAKRTKGQAPRRKVWDQSRKDALRDEAARSSDGQHRARGTSCGRRAKRFVRLGNETEKQLADVQSRNAKPGILAPESVLTWAVMSCSSVEAFSTRIRIWASISIAELEKFYFTTVCAHAIRALQLVWSENRVLPISAWGPAPPPVSLLLEVSAGS